MTKVYMFSYQSMLEDLYLNGIGEIEIENIAAKVVAELELSKAIVIGDTYIVGYMSAWNLKERFNINTYEQQII